MPRVGYAEVIGAAVGGASSAGWFGDGSDGDLIVEAGQEFVLDVALDEGQIVKKYRNVYIGEGAIVRPSNRCNGMVWMVSGDFENHGTISVDGCAPLVNDREAEALAEPHIKLLGGLRGGNGGSGGRSGKFYNMYENYNYSTQFYSYASGAGGNGFALGGGFGGGSPSYQRNGGSGDRAPIGTAIPYRDTASTVGVAAKWGAGGNIYQENKIVAYGGGGYGGSGASYTYYAESEQLSGGNNGDAIGGGLFVLFVGGNCMISASGVVRACGGNGASGIRTTANYNRVYDATGGGGGGGGGIVGIVYGGNYNNLGTVIANGGVGGAHLGSIFANNAQRIFATAGEDGTAGAVLITSLDALLA